MININDTTVAVETSAELKTVLEGTNTISYIYLASDITLAQGISILATKTNITIDGLYPTDSTGKIHTYTDMNSAGSSDAIGVRSASSINITVQNLNVVGKNYYGLIYVSEASSHQNVIVTYKNVTYNGPQITYHPSGLSIYEDCYINIIDSTACVANEVAEAGSIKIGGKTTILHNSTGNSAFWFRGYTNAPFLEIQQGADVSITTTRDIAYSSNYVTLTINKDASFKINTKYGFFRDNSHQASSILVDENSTFSVVQTQTNGSYATISCRGNFTVNSGATLYFQANYQNSAPLILFNTTSASFIANSPKSIILYNKSYNCFSFSNATNISINCGKLDYWQTSPKLISTGVIENNPLYSWYKLDSENLSLTASATSSKTTINSNNLTASEVQALPDLSLLTFQSAKTLRIIEMGNLELKDAPSTIEFQRPLISSSPLILGRKQEKIVMSVIDSRAVSSDWYLYASIDAPLTTSDKKHSLPDSLIFIDSNNDIKTLSSTPTLIFSGTANDGMVKTTSISWLKNTGILFKVIEPLYNGATYSAKITWTLTTDLIT